MGTGKTGLAKEEDLKVREWVFQGGGREWKTIEKRQAKPGGKMNID